MALQTAGMIAAQSVSLSQMLGIATAEPLPALGHLMVVAGLALAATMGLHLRVAEALILSYEALPPGRIPDGAVIAEWGVGGVARAFGLAFSLAAPFLAASLVYNVALGAISKAMPQLMVALVGAPAITLAGLALAAISLPLLLPVWAAALAAVLADPFATP
jgi:flagellar biosynthetic protein FliR